MQKHLAIVLVIALVIAVSNVPSAQGFSGGTGNWKRALEVMKEKRHMCHALKEHCKREFMEDAEDAPSPFKE
ncbi:hypothetical protein ACROYT_G011178 [Oculina patagonica]